jgi:hypothetical protein
MSAPLNVPRGCGFVVTELGRSAAASVETCKCRYVIWDGMLACQYCDTAQGTVKQTSFPYYQNSRKRD